LIDFLDNLPRATRQLSQQSAIIPEIKAESFGDGENKLPVRNLLADISRHRLRKNKNALLMTRRAEAPLLARNISPISI